MLFKPAAFAAALAISTAFSAPAQAAERILFNCFFPPQHYVCQTWLPEMADRIEAATDGRVKMNIPPKSLAAPADQYDGVIGGVMDGAVQFNGFIGNQVPGIRFSLLPFTGSASAEANSVAFWNTYQKFFADKNEYGEAVLLALYATNGSEIMSLTDTPIKTSADIGNRKMWGLPGTVANTLKGTESAVVAGPAVQMLEIISKGVVDGYAGIEPASIRAFKLIDYTKSITMTEGKMFSPTFSFVVSRSKWDKIEEADQQAIRDALGADFAQYMGNFQDGVNKQALAEITAAGVEIITPDPSLEADLRSYGQPMIDAWIAQVAEMGVDGQEVLDFYKAEIEKHAATMAN